MYNRIEICRLLLSLGADLHQKMDTGESALDVYARSAYYPALSKAALQVGLGPSFCLEMCAVMRVRVRVRVRWRCVLSWLCLNFEYRNTHLRAS